MLIAKRTEHFDLGVTIGAGRFLRTFKYVPRLNFIMPRRKRQDALQNPLIVGLSVLIAIFLITSTSFSTPLISITEPSGGTTALNFSAVGVPLLGLLVLIVAVMRLKK